MDDFEPMFREKRSKELLDLAEDGRFDTPECRAKAERLRDVLEASLAAPNHDN